MRIRKIFSNEKIVLSEMMKRKKPFLFDNDGKRGLTKHKTLKPSNIKIKRKQVHDSQI